MTQIYWDTMLFVYWIEAHAEHAARVRHILAEMQRRQDVLYTSVFTIGEVLTGPVKRARRDVAAAIREFMCPPNVQVLPFTAETAEHYARIRATERVSPADAIHLACAAQAGVDLFLTNDRRLQGLVIPGIHFIAGMDVGLF